MRSADSSTLLIMVLEEAGEVTDLGVDNLEALVDTDKADSGVRMVGVDRVDGVNEVDRSDRGIN